MCAPGVCVCAPGVCVCVRYFVWDYNRQYNIRITSIPVLLLQVCCCEAHSGLDSPCDHSALWCDAITVLGASWPTAGLI